MVKIKVETEDLMKKIEVEKEKKEPNHRKEITKQSTNQIPCQSGQHPDGQEREIITRANNSKGQYKQ